MSKRQKAKPKNTKSDRENIFRREPTIRREPTKREIEVIRLVAEGYKNREVAKKLGISVKTAETHRANVMSKFAFRNVIDLITYAFQKGITSIQIEK